jgi:hypothetical protein
LTIERYISFSHPFLGEGEKKKNILPKYQVGV